MSGEKKKKYRVRYDRIVVFVLILVIIGVLVSSCCKAVLSDKDSGDVTAKNPIASAPTEETSRPRRERPTKGNDERPTGPADTTEPTEATEDTSVLTVKLPHDDIYKGDLLLVNADHEYKFADGDVDAVTLFDNMNEYYGAGDFITKLDRKVLTGLNAMIEGYANAMGIYYTDIFVIDGYRTYDEQAERHMSGRSKTFEAGHSDYHTGRTFDMFLSNEYSDSGFSWFSAEGNLSWFADHAGDYGFIVRYPEGKDEATGENARSYTYRYVGTPHAVYINSHNLCLEEYIAEVKKHTNDDPLKVEALDHTYGIYYVQAKDGENVIKLPLETPYTISGDNDGGFIVTVTLS